MIEVALSLAEAKVLEDVLTSSNKKSNRALALAAKNVKGDASKQKKLDEAREAHEEKRGIVMKLRRLLKEAAEAADSICISLSIAELRRLIKVLDTANEIGRVSLLRSGNSKSEYTANVAAGIDRRIAIREKLAKELARAGIGEYS